MLQGMHNPCSIMQLTIIECIHVDSSANMYILFYASFPLCHSAKTSYIHFFFFLVLWQEYVFYISGNKNSVHKNFLWYTAYKEKFAASFN